MPSTTEMQGNKKDPAVRVGPGPNQSRYLVVPSTERSVGCVKWQRLLAHWRDLLLCKMLFQCFLCAFYQHFPQISLRPPAFGGTVPPFEKWIHKSDLLSVSRAIFAQGTDPAATFMTRWRSFPGPVSQRGSSSSDSACSTPRTLVVDFPQSPLTTIFCSPHCFFELRMSRPSNAGKTSVQLQVSEPPVVAIFHVHPCRQSW